MVCTLFTCLGLGLLVSNITIAPVRVTNDLVVLLNLDCSNGALERLALFQDETQQQLEEYSPPKDIGQPRRTGSSGSRLT